MPFQWKYPRQSILAACPNCGDGIRKHRLIVSRGTWGKRCFGCSSTWPTGRIPLVSMALRFALSCVSVSSR